MADYVRIRHDRDYRINSATGQLVINWRFEDLSIWPGLDPSMRYPAPCSLSSTPSPGAGASKRIPQRWWVKVKEINTSVAWNGDDSNKGMRRNDGGWINRAANGEWSANQIIPEDADPLPRPESITSIGNIHEIIERKNGATRIKAYRYSDPVPSTLNPRMLCYFSSIDDKGIVKDMGWIFPLLVDNEAWIPDKRLEFGVMPPTVTSPPENITMSAKLDFVDVSWHRGIIPWNDLRDGGVRGGIAKVSDGWFMPPNYSADGNHFDPQFKSNWAGLEEFDLRGAYHYARLDTPSWRPDSLAQQVINAINYIGLPRKAADVFVIDIEQPASQITSISLDERQDILIEALAAAVDAGWPIEYIWIYTGAWWWGKAEEVGNGLPWKYQMPEVIDPYILQFPVWPANYPATVDSNNNLPDDPDSDDPYEPLVPNGWTMDDVVAWQYSAAGNVEGVTPIDLNDLRWDWDDYLLSGNNPPPIPPIDEDAIRNATLDEATIAVTSTLESLKI